MCLYYWWGSFSSMKMAVPPPNGPFLFFYLSRTWEWMQSDIFLLSLEVKKAWVKYQLQIFLKFVLANWSSRLTPVNCQSEIAVKPFTFLHETVMCQHGHHIGTGKQWLLMYMQSQLNLFDFQLLCLSLKKKNVSFHTRILLNLAIVTIIFLYCNI